MRLGLLTSVDTRHRYVANALRAAVPVVAVGYERTGYDPSAVPATNLTKEEEAVVAAHFDERARMEQIFFGSDDAFIGDGGPTAVRFIPPGELNSTATLAFLEQNRVDAVLIYGTNLIKEPLLSRFASRMINLHLGLSPYYRGTATNFYPLLNEEPEYVGATIHLIDAGIDSGPILRQVRPKITAEDQPHTIGCKTILAGVGALLDVIRAWEGGSLHPVKQWTVDSPRFYRRRDYHPRQVVDLYRKLKSGLIERYVERAALVAPRVRLVT